MTGPAAAPKAFGLSEWGDVILQKQMMIRPYDNLIEVNRERRDIHFRGRRMLRIDYWSGDEPSLSSIGMLQGAGVRAEEAWRGYAYSAARQESRADDFESYALGRWAMRGTPGASARLLDELRLERADLAFDEVAVAILVHIYEQGHATVSELSEWLDTTEDWLAFSRLQRARMLFDSGNEFIVSRDGHAFVKQLVEEAS